MTITEEIIQRVTTLPESAKSEVLDFVEFLKLKVSHTQEDIEWSTFSLSSALRDMENEESLYSLDDIKESFK